MNEIIKQWIFIGGAPRSGTSLLQAIFNQHSICTSPPESHIKETFVYAATTKKRNALNDKNVLKDFLLKDKWIPRLNFNPDDILSRINSGDTGVTLFKLYMEAYAEREGKTVLVEGAPFNIWFMKKLHEDFPGCYILHIVRDPRDVVMSTLKANYNSNIDFPLENVASQFMESYMQGPKFGSKYYNERYIKIYYEDLITKPEVTIKNMCERLHLNYEPAMLSFQESSAKVAAVEEGWKENLNKPFLKDNFNKWKTEMSIGDVVRVEYICREFFELEKEHYSLSEEGKKAMSGIHMELLPLHIKNIKRRIRKVISGKPTVDILDKLPAHERIRNAGLLNLD